MLVRVRRTDLCQFICLYDSRSLKVISRKAVKPFRD